MKYTIFTIYLLILVFQLSNGQNAEWEAIIRQFDTHYRKLNIEPLRIAYLDNLRGIRSEDSLKQQTAVFANLRHRLGQIDYDQLKPPQKLEYELFMHYVLLHEERLHLEQKWLEEPLDSIPEAGLIKLPNGKDWYVYFLKRWLDHTAHPDSLFAFGISEAQKVLSKIENIRVQSGLDSVAFEQYINSEVFFYNNVDSVQQAFESFHKAFAPNLAAFFPGITTIPDLRISRGNIARLAQVPAFYSDNTLFYNFFDRPFSKRQIVWVYMHEALPGHHYEVSIRRAVQQSDLQELFNSPGYSEGWAAYVEEIGNEIGGYKDIYDELGKWEWDLIRSVRVPMDVGLNYYGWDDEQALEFWKKYIKGQDDIGLREIARMRRWPCQVITYKYGADKILDWKTKLEKLPEFDLKVFHEKVLQYGPLPFPILEGLVFEAYD